MIEYNSQHWGTFFKMQGSVFPRAFGYSFTSALLSGLLKYLELSDVIRISDAEEMFFRDNAAYSGFTWTLSFLLIFRTQQCYARFWTCATSCCTLRAQLLEATSSLCVFTLMSKKPTNDIEMFKHKLVRLISLFHALCMEAVADMRDERFKVIDIESIQPQYICMLAGMRDRQKADLVYNWINALIVKSLDSGLLNVPPPILSRVFQEFEKAQVEYQTILQVVDVPFPFPFAQVSAFLCCIYLLLTPIVMLFWCDSAVGAVTFTFISGFCLLSIECIATELEVPCGDDANDLPCHTFQNELNESLILLMMPSGEHVPELLPTARMTYSDLLDMDVSATKSLIEVEMALNLPTDQISVAAKMQLMKSHPLSKEYVSQQQQQPAIQAPPVMTPSAANTPAKLPAPAAAADQMQASVQLLVQCSESLQQILGRKDLLYGSPKEDQWPEQLLQQQGAVHKELMGGLDRLLDKIDAVGKSPMLGTSYPSKDRAFQVKEKAGIAQPGSCCGQVQQPSGGGIAPAM